jgi:hypothetical protein
VFVCRHHTKAKQSFIRNRIVNAVTRTYINPKFPNPIAAEFVVTKISEFDPVHSAIDRNTSFDIAQFKPPIEINIFRIFGEIVANFIPNVYSFINDKVSRVPKTNSMP